MAENDDILYVAVGKEVEDRHSTLKWALNGFKHGNFYKIGVIYVLAPAQTIPQPNGFEAPVPSVREHEVASFREREQQEMVDILEDCGDICKTHKVPFQIIPAQNESITEGILEIIVTLRIQKLVMGAAANRSYSRRMVAPMSKKANFVLHTAPNFCHIWFVCNNRVIFMRERARQIERIHLTKSSYSKFLRSSLLCTSAGSSSQSPSIHQRSLPSSTVPPNIIDNVYAQLQQSKKVSKELTEKLHIESMKRLEAEKEVAEKNLKVLAADRYLIQMKAELTDTKIRLEEALNDLGIANLQTTSFRSQIENLYLRAKELEDKLVASENSRNMDKNLYNRLRERLKHITQEQRNLDFRIVSSEYSVSDLEEATNSFDSSSKIGERGYRCTYRGFLSCTYVAIKMLHSISFQCTLEFKREVGILCKLRHPNMILLLGICTNPRGLIYEYLPNGNLQDRLNCKDNTPPLPWKRRIQIAIELCSVLNFLHSRKPNSIIHGDINPKNVLLGDKFICKLSGFGSCRAIPNTRVDFQTALKTDVYYFGVILLCLLTAQSPSGIVERVQSSLDDDNLYNILDHSAGQWPFVRARQLAILALRCCHVRPDDRPDLSSEVWRVLKPIIDPSRRLSNPLRHIHEEQIPSHFICPILQEIMHDPHFAADGFTYEGNAIKALFDGGQETSPTTNLRLQNCHLTPNHALRSAIEGWLQIYRFGKEVEDRHSTLKWALNRFKHENCDSICVFYVLAPAPTITLPNGFEGLVHTVAEHEIRKWEKREMVAILDDCGDICKTHKVPFQSIQAQNESITEGIIETIVNQRIQKLVMGAAANRSYLRTLTPMSIKATFVLHNAPNFCHIWFVCNSHLVFTRECARQHTENIERIQLNKSSSEYLCSSLLCASTGGSSSQSPSIHHALPCNTMPPNIIDNVYAQLQQTEKDSKELTEKLHIESLKRQKAEIEASEKNLKMQVVDEILIQMEAELTLTKNRLNKTLNELGDASTQIKSFQSQTSQWNIKVKKKESELITSTNSHNMYKKLSNGLQEKLDHIAQEQQILPCEYIESDLQEATNSFDSSFKVAEGDYGCIYRGFLSYSDVAIKVLRTNSLRCTLEFKQEVDILRKLHHPHVVALLGMCTQPLGLIYEYLPNGSLQDRLNCKGNTPPLPWQTRIQIAAELCSALAFLHSRKPDSIIHGDINPENVLLGDNFICKLSGFGSSRVISNTRVDFQTALKNDVYSFGVTLLCLLTAESPTGIKEKMQSSLTNDDLYNIIVDHSVGQWPSVRATQLAHMALRCCHVIPDDRPDLASEVWMVLKPSIDPSQSLSNPVQLIREDQIPSDFLCPINQDIMHDPHFAADGFTYEESAIKRWFDGGHETSPMTNRRLENRHLTPNRALRSAIEKWQQKHRCV